MNDLIIFGAKYLFIIVVFLWIMAWWQAARSHRKQMAWAAIAAVIIAAILDKLTSKLYYDPRPFVTHHLHPLVSHVADNGFPSEHTLFSMTIAVSLVFFRPKVGWAAIAIAILVGISRVTAHVHSPIDIAGAAAMGLIAGYLGYQIAVRLIPLKAHQVKRGAGQPADPK